MNIEKLKEILGQITDIYALDVDGDGYHFQIKVASNVFEGKNTLARQKYVYQFLKDYIADGTLHAVEIKTYTPIEWDKQ
jgi:acid stress-induced BolA-like protein IbaG/YrbA